MGTLAMDIETFSDVDLNRSGVYAYTASSCFEILLLAYAFDSEEVQVIDLSGGERLPDRIVSALDDEGIIKTAYNAQFERVCLSRHLDRNLDAVSWQCTEALCASLGLPRSLEGAAEALQLKETKIKEGRELIRYFSVPCRPTRYNGQRDRNLPCHDEAKWEAFKNYCRRDVEVERAIRSRLIKYPMSEREQKIYVLDQQINDRGIFVDLELADNAVECDRLYREKIFSQAKELSGLQNPNSVAQLKQWLTENGANIGSLSKKAVSALAKESGGRVGELMNLRLQLSKTSVKKYEAIMRSVCPDGRVRGLLQFYGAERTGRWAGRLVQVQNLPQNHLRDLSLARELVKDRDFDTLEMLYGSVPGVLSELIRTAFIPKMGHEFIVADFSAIEARIIAWLAGEKWRMDVFRGDGKIYEASASRMFSVPIGEITKTSPLRQKGKIAELALGYGGSVGALTSMGALEMGLKEDELPGLVAAWRNANPSITKLWRDTERAALKAVREGKVSDVGRVRFHYENGILFITLPSGRRLAYIKPKIEADDFGKPQITFMGVGATKKWERIKTYGPKLVENIVQAAARDLLSEAMLRVAGKGMDIVMHVHDEIIVEAESGRHSLEEVCALMDAAPAWAEGLPLRADGFVCGYYRKD